MRLPVLTADRPGLIPGPESGEQVMTPGECSKELVIEVVSVGDHKDCRVFHCGVPNHLSRIEDHGKAFSDPWVCQTTPHLRFPLGPDAEIVVSMAFLTAWNW